MAPPPVVRAAAQAVETRRQNLRGDAQTRTVGVGSGTSRGGQPPLVVSRCATGSAWTHRSLLRPTRSFPEGKNKAIKSVKIKEFWLLELDGTRTEAVATHGREGGSGRRNKPTASIASVALRLGERPHRQGSRVPKWQKQTHFACASAMKNDGNSRATSSAGKRGGGNARARGRELTLRRSLSASTRAPDVRGFSKPQ